MKYTFKDINGANCVVDQDNMGNHAFNVDCMIALKATPDKFYELCICDPPYGISMDGGKIGGDNKGKATDYIKKSWDAKAPDDKYFFELLRASKNQIIFGANHFISHIPIDSPCWIVWDKDNTGNFADCELAWTSFKSAVRKYEFRWNGMLQGNMSNKETRIHPTQKPVAVGIRLYYLIRKFSALAIYTR